MRRDWYDAKENPSRTINLCEECYVPDKLAGKRTEAIWERADSIWVEIEYQDDYGVREGYWDNVVRSYEESPSANVERA